MSALSLRLPNSLHDRARKLARREGISINQLVATALAEKMSALLTEEYLVERAKHGSRSRFLKALGRVPDVPPDSRDRFSTEASNDAMHLSVRASRRLRKGSKRRAAAARR